MISSREHRVSRWDASRTASLALVLAQFAVCTLLLLVTPWRELSRSSWLVSLPLLLAGLLVGLWAWLAIGLRRLRIMPEPGASTRLCTAGPYAWVRHPMYSGLLLFFLGVVGLAPTLASGGLWLVLGLVLWSKAMREERYLRRAFAEYDDYCRHTGRFLPRIHSS